MTAAAVSSVYASRGTFRGDCNSKAQPRSGGAFSRSLLSPSRFRRTSAGGTSANSSVLAKPVLAGPVEEVSRGEVDDSRGEVDEWHEQRGVLRRSASKGAAKICKP